MSDSTFKLGFGLMRLPKLPGGAIDVEQTKQMADAFLAAGGSYFDTAFIYDRGRSEEAFREAVVKRYPRERYTITSKLCAWQPGQNEESSKQQFFTSLERTGVGYFDYYLLHALQPGNFHLYDQYHLWDFLREQKEKGLVRHIGFSFHGDPALLGRILTEHPEADMVLMQINYADWEDPGVQARANYEMACRHGKMITVMEPLKGGALVHPFTQVGRIFKAADPEASYASWALRFVASLPGVSVVLSGMSSLEQMEDNLSFMKDLKPLSQGEQEVIRKAQEALSADKSIPCTGCRYCVKGCPMNIPIPDVFNVVNRSRGSAAFRTRREYSIVTREKGKASDCVACGQCEAICPQHLKIIDLLKECRELED